MESPTKVAMQEGFVVAREMRDDNGNWWYLQLSDAWATESLAHSDARYHGYTDYVVVPASQHRLWER